MSNNSLYALCNELPFINSKIINDSIYKSTSDALENLYSTYGYSNVLSELSKILPYEKALSFFHYSNEFATKGKKIRTIATQYHKCHSGGIERVQAQLMCLWTNMGYKVVLLSEEPSHPLDYPYPHSVKRIIIPKITQLTERLHTLETICQEEQIDLYVNHNWGEKLALWECVLLRLLNIPSLQYVHGHFAWSIAQNRDALCQPEFFSLYNLVLSLSETNARFYQLCGCKSYFVHNPIPDDLVQNKEIASLTSKHILMIGRIAPEKNPLNSLSTFKLVYEQIPDAILDIVGSGDEKIIISMKKYIQDNGLTKNVVFHGAQNNSEVNKHYINSSCVIFTSKMEGYPMVLLEAKSFGIPIVMYNMPYLTLTNDGKGVLTSNYQDDETMSANIIRLLQNDQYRKEIGKESRNSFLHFLTYDLQGNWENIISICANNKLSVSSDAYYDPNMLNNAEKNIEPILLEQFKKYYEFQDKKALRLGKKILFIPRKLKKLIKKRNLHE